MSKNLISVITPFRNAERYYLLYLTTLCRQLCVELQPILIDDDSSSTSGAAFFADFIKTKFPRALFVRTRKNIGPGAARNIGLEIAEGDLISFLDIDDIWLPRKIISQVDYLRNNNISGCCSAYVPFDSGSGRMLRPIQPPAKVAMWNINRGNPVGTLTVCLRAKLAKEIQFPDLRTQEDFRYWYAFISRFGAIGGMKEITALYRISGNSVSANKKKVLSSMFRTFRDGYGQPPDEASLHSVAHCLRGIKRSIVYGGLRRLR
jgi:glycosyltransferase involved in cell wall biosynthesis